MILILTQIKLQEDGSVVSVRLHHLLHLLLLHLFNDQHVWRDLDILRAAAKVSSIPHSFAPRNVYAACSKVVSWMIIARMSCSINGEKTAANTPSMLKH